LNSKRPINDTSRFSAGAAGGVAPDGFHFRRGKTRGESRRRCGLRGQGACLSGIAPEVLFEMQEAFEAQDAAKAKAALRENAKALFDDPRDPSVGPKDAKTVVVLFQDYQCAHCKAEATPAVMGLTAKHSDIRIVFKELPIFGPKSQAAARAAIAAARQGKYFGTFKALMADTILDEAAIETVLKANGVDLQRAKADAEAKETSALLDDNAKLAHRIGVEGTPTFVVGDRLILGADAEQIEKAISR
jgi:protein-disulfide isomerase